MINEELSQARVTPEVVYAAALKLKMYVSAYMNKLADIAEGDDDREQQDRALEWREDVSKALEEVDELHAKLLRFPWEGRERKFDELINEMLDAYDAYDEDLYNIRLRQLRKLALGA